MSWLTRAFSSSIGRKYIVAITGLALIGFLIAHLIGNLLVFVGPEALAAYAKGLRDYPLLLLIARVGLVVIFVLHIYYAITLNRENRRARPVPYAKKQFQEASWASRQMVITGLLVLFYLLYHLAHFTWRVTDDHVRTVGEWEVYEMVVGSFQNPAVSITYILAMILTGIHLWHGGSAFFHSLGMKHPKYNKCIHCVGPALAVLLSGGFISIPLAILLGVVK